MKKIIVASLAVFAASVLCFAGSSSGSDQVKRQKEMSKKNVDDVKSRVDKMKIEISEKNKQYRVGITSVIKMKISEITGAKAPVAIDDEAKVQSRISDRLFREYLKRLEASRRQSFSHSQPVKKTEPIQDTEQENNSGQAKKTEPEKTAGDTELAKDAEPAKEKEGILPAGTTEAAEETAEKGPDPSLRYFSWKDKGIATPVKYQAQCGSCWTFTSAAVLEGSANLTYKTVLDLSEQSILDCSRTKSGKKAGSCDGGWYGYVFDYYMNTPVIPESSDPYKGKNSICGKYASENYRVAAWGYVRPDAGIPSVQEMKAALCKYGPIAASVKVTEHFQAYTGGIFDENAKVSGPRDINHGITITGWDDSKKAYQLKNSWGTDWGEDGYMWIEYGCNNIGYGAAWVAVEKIQN